MDFNPAKMILKTFELLANWSLTMHCHCSDQLLQPEKGGRAVNMVRGYCYGAALVQNAHKPCTIYALNTFPCVCLAEGLVLAGVAGELFGGWVSAAQACSKGQERHSAQ